MKNRSLLLMATLAVAGGMLSSCKKKSSSETTTVSKPAYQVGQPVSDATTVTGAVNGTMLTGKTYHLHGNVIIQPGDTLLVQPGVTCLMDDNADIVVKGVFLSLGTKDQPNTFTSADNLTRMDNVGQDPGSDPAYEGKWAGINADTTCNLMVIKWSHLNYTGALFNSDPPFSGAAQGDASYAILFQNPQGDLIFEDNWVYGTIDDAMRITSGRFEVLRNTFEKCGFTGGDVINAKSGSVGDMAYNLFVGAATNGTKASDKGGAQPQTDVNMYNNTYINCGYRRVESGRGGGINYEQDAKGKGYNNLMVDCRFGFRVVGDPAADTSNMAYGYSWNYVDSTSIANEIYPTGYITEPKGTDVPAPSSFLPAGYQLGQNYDGSSVVGLNDPKFKNFPLPETGISHFSDISAVGNFDFHLASGSPCIGAGYTGFAPLAATHVTNPNYAPDVTPPGVDMGCFQSDGTGNQH